MKPMSLTAPKIERLKLKHDVPLSNFAFKFNLRRYTKEPEFEAGLMMCSSALYVDGKLPVDVGLSPDKSAASASGAGAAALGAARHTAEQERQAKLVGPRASDALAANPDPGGLARLGGKDKRFDSAIMSR